MKNSKKSFGTRLAACLLLVLMVLVSFPVNAVSAKTKELKLTETKMTLTSGESAKLKVKERPYKKNDVITSYWESSDDTIASVGRTGIVEALVPGTVTVTYSESAYTDTGYQYFSAECKITVKKGEYSLKKHEASMVEEESITLALPDCDSVTYRMNYDSYPMAYLDVEQDYENNVLVVTGTDAGTVYLDVSFLDAKGKVICTDRCKITVLRKGIDITSITRAVGKSYEFTVNGYDASQIVGWESEDPEIASVSKSGKMKAEAEGTTYITLTVLDEYGDEREYGCEVDVSNPRLEQTEQNLAVDCSTSIDIQGLAYSSEIDSVSSKPEVAEIDGQYIYAKAKGTAVITIQVDGVKLKYKVRVTNPSVSDVLIAIEKGKSRQISMTGTNKYSVVSYKSTNKKIATVNKSGKIKTIKNGTATITIDVDGKTFSIPVSVSNAKVVSALKYAVAAIGTPYSQANRMSSGYFDCSSLAWRSYHTANVNFGNNSWAPTAAGMAEYLVKNKKAIAYENLPPEKLQPGDLLFFAKEDNGRYKNIYHVAIYAGTISQVYGWGDDTAYNTGLLLEARNEGVGLFSYDEFGRQVVVVARPTK